MTAMKDIDTWSIQFLQNEHTCYAIKSLQSKKITCKPINIFLAIMKLGILLWLWNYNDEARFNIDPL
jgi:hypothetical protein